MFLLFIKKNDLLNVFILYSLRLKKTNLHKDETLHSTMNLELVSHRCLG